MTESEKIAKLASFELPSPLPVGMKEFEEFYQDIIQTYGLPDMPSYKRTMAMMIMRLPDESFEAPKAYFGRCIKKAMANQIAHAIIDQVINVSTVNKPEVVAGDSTVDEPVPVQGIQETSV